MMQVTSYECQEAVRTEFKTQVFEVMSTEELRAEAKVTDDGRANWDRWTREMLLAFFHNRYGPSRLVAAVVTKEKEG